MATRITADRWTVGNWIELWSQKEIDEVLTDLINDDYTVEMLSQDYDEWVRENSNKLKKKVEENK